MKLSWCLPSDVPGPVGIPLTAENLSSDSCKLNWFFPENDGGSPISNFIIEKREAERKAWTSVSFTASRQNAVVHGLTTGKSYFFRVAAENAIGIGPFVETAAEVIIKEPVSEYNYVVSECLYITAGKIRTPQEKKQNPKSFHPKN